MTAPFVLYLCLLVLVCMFLLVALQHARIRDLEQRFRLYRDMAQADHEHIEREARLLRARVNLHALCLGYPTWKNSALKPGFFHAASRVGAANMPEQ